MMGLHVAAETDRRARRALREGASLVRQGWTRKYWARLQDGLPAEYDDPRCCSWCPEGAVRHSLMRRGLPPYGTIALRARDLLAHAVGPATLAAGVRLSLADHPVPLEEALAELDLASALWAWNDYAVETAEEAAFIMEHAAKVELPWGSGDVA